MPPAVPNLDALTALASTSLDGTPLVFSGEEFSQIESLLVGALSDIGALRQRCFQSIHTRSLCPAFSCLPLFVIGHLVEPLRCSA